jgi:hypothetical protein
MPTTFGRDTVEQSRYAADKIEIFRSQLSIAMKFVVFKLAFRISQPRPIASLVSEIGYQVARPPSGNLKLPGIRRERHVKRSTSSPHVVSEQMIKCKTQPEGSVAHANLQVANDGPQNEFNANFHVPAATKVI